MTSSTWPDAWPFFLASGLTVGHAVVMAPAFLIEQGRHRALARAVATPDGQSGDWSRRDFSDPDRTLTLFFRDVAPPPALVGENAVDLRDGSNRLVLLTEGVVVRGAPADLDPRIAALAEPVVLAAFARFWLADDQFADTVEAPRLDPGMPPPEFPTPPPGGLRGAGVRPEVVRPEPPQSQPPQPLPEPEGDRQPTLWIWIVAGVVLALGLCTVLIVVLGASHRS
jgi:hypothetical protein